jgi:hypothetical protein
MSVCNLQLISWVESESGGNRGNGGEGKCEGGGTTVLRWNGCDDGSATTRHYDDGGHWGILGSSEEGQCTANIPMQIKSTTVQLGERGQ